MFNFPRSVIALNNVDSLSFDAGAAYDDLDRDYVADHSTERRSQRSTAARQFIDALQENNGTLLPPDIDAALWRYIRSLGENPRVDIVVQVDSMSRDVGYRIHVQPDDSRLGQIIISGTQSHIDSVQISEAESRNIFYARAAYMDDHIALVDNASDLTLGHFSNAQLVALFDGAAATHQRYAQEVHLFAADRERIRLGASHDMAAAIAGLVQTKCRSEQIDPERVKIKSDDTYGEHVISVEDDEGQVTERVTLHLSGSQLRLTFSSEQGIIFETMQELHITDAPLHPVDRRAHSASYFLSVNQLQGQDVGLLSEAIRDYNQNRSQLLAGGL